MTDHVHLPHSLVFKDDARYKITLWYLSPKVSQGGRNNAIITLDASPAAGHIPSAWFSMSSLTHYVETQLTGILKIGTRGFSVWIDDQYRSLQSIRKFLKSE